MTSAVPVVQLFHRSKANSSFFFFHCNLKRSDSTESYCRLCRGLTSNRDVGKPSRGGCENPASWTFYAFKCFSCSFCEQKSTSEVGVMKQISGSVLFRSKKWLLSFFPNKRHVAPGNCHVSRGGLNYKAVRMDTSIR